MRDTVLPDGGRIVRYVENVEERRVLTGYHPWLTLADARSHSTFQSVSLWRTRFGKHTFRGTNRTTERFNLLSFLFRDSDPNFLDSEALTSFKVAILYLI